MDTHLGEKIAATLKTAYAEMDPSTGMFPADWTCKVCGKVLNADGGHPAELYAGTYSGLCYACERGPAYVVPDSELPDGGRLVSHPPACPSWRRDRTTHWGYPDCEECKGQGARKRYGHNGDYTEYCRACMARVMVKRKHNEVVLLRTVAGALEMCPLRDVEPDEDQTPAWASLSEATRRVTTMAMRMFDSEPTIWTPLVSILNGATVRLTSAQSKAKRADTLKRHVVAALRAEADERSAA